MNFNFTWAVIFLVLFVIANAVMSHFIKKREQRHSREEFEKAKGLIRSLGLKANLYLPASGELENEELARALTLLGGEGFIITDDEGYIVGKVALQLNPDEVAQVRRAKFVLID